MRTFYNLVILIFTCSCIQTHKQDKFGMTFDYPNTKKDSTLQTYFGTTINDPYRWLENDQGLETKKWVAEQNKTTNHFLNKITLRETIKKKLTALWNYEKISMPFKEGAYTYFYKNDGLQNQSVLYRYKDSITKAELFLDPNTFSDDGTTSLGNVSFSKSGNLLAYAISEGGSDWQKVILIDALTKSKVGETLNDVKFSALSWKGDEGFYYSSYDKPTGSELSAKTDQHKLYYHTVGHKQIDDQLIFGGIPNQKRRYVGGSTSEDDRFLFISAAKSTSGNELYLIDLKNDPDTIIPVLTDFKSDAKVIDTNGDMLFIDTNRNAPNSKLVKVNAQKPTPENWETVIPETDHALSVSSGSTMFFAKYMVDALIQVKQYDYTGNLIRKIELPDIGSANGFSGKKEDTTLYYQFSNPLSSELYAYDSKTGISKLHRPSACKFNAKNYESKQVFYTSKDGTKIPMLISYKKA